MKPMRTGRRDSEECEGVYAISSGWIGIKSSVSGSREIATDERPHELHWVYREPGNQIEKSRSLLDRNISECQAVPAIGGVAMIASARWFLDCQHDH